MELEDLVKVKNSSINEKDIDKITLLVYDLFESFKNNLIISKTELKNLIDKNGRLRKVMPSVIKILSVYRALASNSEIEYNSEFEKLLKKKVLRSASGVIVITVFTSPYPETSKGVQEFSCEYDCHYCPKEPNQPRSYLLKEPGVLRANHNKFISTDQFWDRARSYILMGHPLDKIELIISGGTMSSYPREYIINFFRDQFYAANVAYDKITGREIRDALSLQEEQDINQNIAMVKIIGITMETRPDRINRKELIFLRQLGVTRVQIGVQHLDDRILTHINRRCKTIHTIKAIKLLKESGFKVDIHLMPDLPHPEDISMEEMIILDRKMFNDVIELQEFQADQWKIYPCSTVPWTEIEKWHKEGSYKPYGEIVNEDGSGPLFDLLIEVKQKVKPWIRLNRIIRDIPNSYLIGGNQNSAMRGDLLNIFAKRNLKCNCIRCREVKTADIDIDKFEIKVRQYKASDGIEIFISWEDENDTLLGFLRLRINENEKNDVFEELSGCAIIRELHVYGQVIIVNNASGSSAQHRGLGSTMIDKAIEITLEHGITKIAVIAGVGVRNYYINKKGFVIDNGLGHFLIKYL